MGDVIHAVYGRVYAGARSIHFLSAEQYFLSPNAHARTRDNKVNIIHNFFFHSVYAFLLRWYTGNAYLINSIF